MNQKKAKTLRRIVGYGHGSEPMAVYQILQVPKSTTNVRRGSFPIVKQDGTTERVWPKTAKQARLKPGCVRHQYKQLKRAA